MPQQLWHWGINAMCATLSSDMWMCPAFIRDVIINGALQLELQYATSPASVVKALSMQQVGIQMMGSASYINSSTV